MTENPTPVADQRAGRVDRVTARVIEFIRDAFLDGDPRGELDERTPLLEWGVLSSLKMTQLLVYLREGLDEPDRVPVPALEISGPNFRTVRAIAELVDRLAA
jgi:hypothetical protein